MGQHRIQRLERFGADLDDQVPAPVGGVDRAHLGDALQLADDPVGAAPLDPDHHQPAHRRAGQIAPGDDAEADDLAGLLEPLDPRPHGGARNAEAPGQLGQRGPRILPQGGDELSIKIVHMVISFLRFAHDTFHISKMIADFTAALRKTRLRKEPAMTPRTCILIGAPIDSGKRRAGCLMGPDALRTAGLPEALADLGHRVEDRGNLAIDLPPPAPAPEGALFGLKQTARWTAAIAAAAEEAMGAGLPIFLGGDHALSLGSLGGVAAHAARAGRPQFVLWLDAHSDFHTPQTTASGHLHGTPLAYATGRPGFEGFPPPAAPIPEENICLLGLRSVDAAERAALEASRIRYHDMRAIDEHGIARPLAAFLEDVARAGGALHVSLDVDFLDPAIAPAVGTTVPGGATLREAHLVMEMLHDSALMSSLDIAELNPFLDERGRSAKVMVDLAASALGRRVFDRPTRAYD